MRKGSRILSAILCLSTLVCVLAQQPQNQQSDAEIIRISTELVQTSITVFDKQNQFVTGLKPEQFELRVDGKPTPVSFVEHVMTGAKRASGAPSNVLGNTNSRSLADASSRGRTIIFFIDDLHLSAAGVDQTRKAFLDFIDREMSPDDQIAVASSSGQIGFLQSFTDVKAVLRAAIARLSYRPNVLQDTENIPMTEYQAIKIEQGERDATDYYINELLKASNFSLRRGGGPSGGGAVASSAGTTPNRYTGMTREMAERNVKNRAQFLLRQSGAVTVITLAALESLMRSSSNEPGRKLLFLVSDGFYLNDHNTGFSERLKQITDAATRAGVVIYSLDSKGLAGVTDAGSNRADGDGRLARTNVGERTGLQDPLTAMAANTGGRAFLDSDAVNTGLKSALAETANYYVVAWRPPTDEQRAGKFKQVEVSIVGRPELTVRMARGFIDAGNSVAADPPVKVNAVTPTANEKGNSNPLRDALISSSSKRGLPTKLATSFLDVPKTGLVLTASTQIATDVLGYGPEGKNEATINLVGVVLDDQGKQAGNFKTRITVKPSTQKVEHPGVVYTHKLPLKPGIYQVRVAVQDEKSNRVGSSMQWIEMPDLSAKRLTLSSLLVGGQFVGARQTEANANSPQGQVQFSVDRRFQRGSHMNFMTFIYGAARKQTGSPQLAAQIVISRNGQAVVTSPVREVPLDANTDLDRIIYGADIALQNLPTGRFLLEVKIEDRVANTRTSQQVMFEIE